MSGMSPRPPVERVVRAIRLRKEADAELVRRAKAARLSVNGFLEQELYPGVRLPCLHPRKARQVFSWGSRCGDCGVRL